ncbi:MAG: phosphotransferase [Mycobacteriales bacterium]
MSQPLSGHPHEVDLPRMLADPQPELAPWSVVRTLPGGSQSATLVRDIAGHLAVTKVHPDAPVAYFEAVRQRVDTLRARGIPAPRVQVHDLGSAVLLVQEHLAGRSHRPLTLPLVEALLALSRLQTGLADENPLPWRNLIRESLTEGLHGYREHSSLAGFNDSSRHLLRRIQAIGQDPALDRLPAEDLFHYDLHPANVLSTDSRTVSGIIEWDAVRSGDRLLDVIMLALTSMWRAGPDVQRRLWEEVFELGTVDRRTALLHHAVLRLVDWNIRHQEPKRQRPP